MTKALWAQRKDDNERTKNDNDNGNDNGNDNERTKNDDESPLDSRFYILNFTFYTLHSTF